MATDEWDRGIIAKLERALALRDVLKAEQARLRGDGQDRREYDSASNDTDHTNPMVWREWRLTEAPDPLPLSFAALLGDVIQNLRAALDYTAWSAATDNARKQHHTQVYFPLLTKQRDFTKWVRDRSGWFSDDTVKVMKWAQPYQAAKDQLHPLRILQVLSNTDKHRLLNVVDHAHIEQGIVMLPEPPVYDFWSAEGPVRPGDLSARLEFPRPPFKLSIDVMPIFGWYESVAYEEPGQDIRWLRIDELLNAVLVHGRRGRTDVGRPAGLEAGERRRRANGPDGPRVGGLEITRGGLGAAGGAWESRACSCRASGRAALAAASASTSCCQNKPTCRPSTSAGASSPVNAGKGATTRQYRRGRFPQGTAA